MLGPRILLVDDHQDTLHLFETCLSLFGFRVTPVNNGAEALRQASKGFDAIATDLAMPGMDGIELIRRVRQLRSCSVVPIVAVTGQVVDPTVSARNNIGCCRLLRKPCDLEHFAETLSQLIRACPGDCTTCSLRGD